MRKSHFQVFTSKKDFEAMVKKMGLVPTPVILPPQPDPKPEEEKALIKKASDELMKQHPTVKTVTATLFTNLDFKNNTSERGADLQGQRADGSVSPTAKLRVTFK